VALLAANIILGLNGYEIEAAEPEVVTAFESVAAGRISEASLAAWVRKRLRPIADSQAEGRPAAPLPPYQLPIRHPMRLIRIRPLPLLQIFYIGLKIPLELRTRKRGNDGIGVIFIGEMAAGRVVHPWHEPMFVTMPLVTDPTTRRTTTIGASLNQLIRIDRLPPELGSDSVNHLNASATPPVALVHIAWRGPW
jgi:hypothetical protein